MIPGKGLRCGPSPAIYFIGALQIQSVSMGHPNRSGRLFAVFEMRSVGRSENSWPNFTQMSGRHTGQLDDASRREPATGEAGRCKSGLRVGVTHAWASRGYGSNVKD